MSNNTLEVSSSPDSLGFGVTSHAPSRIRTLIVDDQAIARDFLCHMLRHEEDIEIVGTAANGLEALEAINRLAPDLVFLDVQMPEADGFSVLNQIEPSRMPVVIFVTANESFALKAFDVQALDYLVKPCTRDRLGLALQRAREQIRRDQAGATEQKLSALLNDFRAKPRHPERLAVKSDGRIIFLELTDLDWIESADNYVNLHVGAQAHLLRETMSALETRLPVDRFMRISRSTIVNINRIKELQPMFHGEYVVVLRNGTRLTLTRSYRDKLGQLGYS